MKWFNKLKRRYNKWKSWRKWCHYGRIKQWLILLGLKYDYWFENFPY